MGQGSRFGSILFESPEGEGAGLASEEPTALADLNLDQVFAAMLLGREEYDLAPFLWTPLQDASCVSYRQEVLRDLENDALLAAVKTFADRMHTVRTYRTLMRKLRYRPEVHAWILETVSVYVEAVASLTHDLVHSSIRSRGLLAFVEYLLRYTGSEAFASMTQSAQQVREELDRIRYEFRIDGGRVTVDRYADEIDYSEEVRATFARFRQGAVKDYRANIVSFLGLNHVEGQILTFVTRLFPEAFRSLEDFGRRYEEFLDPLVVTFDREVQVFVAYLEYIRPIREAGLPFCYPTISNPSKDVRAAQAYDLALASKLIGRGSDVVANDFSLSHEERIIVVTGPNQGGKTTFARTFGQLHYLAALGFPVPAGEARLFLADELFTHFERQEDIRTLRGKLEDELFRVHEILRVATGDSLVVMNESLTSTTLDDAVVLGQEVMARLVSLDALCVWVTFVDELASFAEATVSMVATVSPDNPADRTFRIVRQPADGRAYALAIAEKYGLSDQLVGRRMRR